MTWISILFIILWFPLLKLSGKIYFCWMVFIQICCQISVLAMVCFIWLCYYFTHKELFNKMFLCFQIDVKNDIFTNTNVKSRNWCNISQILKWINPIFVLMLFFIFFSHMKFDRYNNGRIRVHAGSSLKKFIKLLNLLGEKSSNYWEK